MKSISVWLALFASAAAISATTASAEQMFVTDKLVLNVHSEPDGESERIAVLETGDAVDTVEQLGNFTRIRLSDGREGWVAANDLTLEPPALVRLRALAKEHKAAAQKAEKAFKAQLDELNKQNEALQAELDNLKKAEAARAAAEAAAKAQQQAQREAEQAKAAEESSSKFNLAWLWAPFVLLAGGAGYAAGYQTLARKIRNKFGGVKIY